MHFDPENTQRTVWVVTDRVEFFEKMKELLNIGEDDAEEIADRLQERNFDYLEVAAYLPGSESEDPDATLVFDGKKDVYWDIFNTEKTSEILAKIHRLAGSNSKLTHARGLTQRDWRKRLEALSGF